MLSAGGEHHIQTRGWPENSSDGYVCHTGTEFWIFCSFRFVSSLYFSKGIAVSEKTPLTS